MKVEKILVVDDSQLLRQLLRSMIADLVGTIYECADGAEALRAYAEHRPDWVLMDIAMPGVDGLAATRRIREGFPEAKILIVTNYGEAALREAARAAGACGYVLKDDLCEVRDVISAGH